MARRVMGDLSSAAQLLGPGLVVGGAGVTRVSCNGRLGDVYLNPNTLDRVALLRSCPEGAPVTIEPPSRAERVQLGSGDALVRITDAALRSLCDRHECCRSTTADRGGDRRPASGGGCQAGGQRPYPRLQWHVDDYVRSAGISRTGDCVQRDDDFQGRDAHRPRATRDQGERHRLSVAGDPAAADHRARTRLGSAAGDHARGQVSLQTGWG